MGAAVAAGGGSAIAEYHQDSRVVQPLQWIGVGRRVTHGLHLLTGVDQKCLETGGTRLATTPMAEHHRVIGMDIHHGGRHRHGRHHMAHQVRRTWFHRRGGAHKWAVTLESRPLNGVAPQHRSVRHTLQDRENRKLETCGVHLAIGGLALPVVARPLVQMAHQGIQATTRQPPISNVATLSDLWTRQCLAAAKLPAVHWPQQRRLQRVRLLDLVRCLRRNPLEQGKGVVLEKRRRMRNLSTQMMGMAR